MFGLVTPNHVSTLRKTWSMFFYMILYLGNYCYIFLQLQTHVTLAYKLILSYFILIYFPCHPGYVIISRINRFYAFNPKLHSLKRRDVHTLIIKTTNMSFSKGNKFFFFGFSSQMTWFFFIYTLCISTIHC